MGGPHGILRNTIKSGVNRDATGSVQMCFGFGANPMGAEWWGNLNGRCDAAALAVTDLLGGGRLNAVAGVVPGGPKPQRPALIAAGLWPYGTPAQWLSGGGGPGPGGVEWRQCRGRAAGRGGGSGGLMRVVCSRPRVGVAPVRSLAGRKEPLR